MKQKPLSLFATFIFLFIGKGLFAQYEVASTVEFENSKTEGSFTHTINRKGGGYYQVIEKEESLTLKEFDKNLQLVSSQDISYPEVDGVKGTPKAFIMLGGKPTILMNGKSRKKRFIGNISGGKWDKIKEIPGPMSYAEEIVFSSDSTNLLMYDPLTSDSLHMLMLNSDLEITLNKKVKGKSHVRQALVSNDGYAYFLREISEQKKGASFTDPPYTSISYSIDYFSKEDEGSQLLALKDNKYSRPCNRP